jgi:hypothetical protein
MPAVALRRFPEVLPAQPFQSEEVSPASRSVFSSGEALTRRTSMKLNAPTQVLWLISVILGGLGILSHFVRIQTISPYAFELLAIGFVILVIGTLLKRA